MCDPVSAIEDVAAAALAPETGGLSLDLLPAITAGTDLAEGKGLKNSLIGGAETFAGQEAAGALGIGSGNGLVNNALGLDISPAATGLPDVGGALQNLGNDAANAIGFNSSGVAVPSTTGNAATGSFDINGNSVTPTPTTATSVSPVGGSGGIVSPSGASDFSLNSTLNQTADNLGSGAATSASTGLGTLSGNNVASGSFDLGGNFNTPASGAAAAASPNLASAPGADSSSGAGSSFLSNAGNIAEKAALPLGTAAYEAIKGPPALPSADKALAANGAVTAPLIATENQGLNAYNSGTLTGPQQAQITQYIQQQQNQLIQQLASQGVTNVHNDSRYIEGMATIQQQAAAQIQNLLQQDVQNAFSAAGAAGQNLSSVANSQTTNDQTFQSALNAAMQALGGSIGGGGVTVQPKV